jgi:hypothetical protein
MSWTAGEVKTGRWLQFLPVRMSRWHERGASRHDAAAGRTEIVAVKRSCGLARLLLMAAGPLFPAHTLKRQGGT